MANAVLDGTDCVMLSGETANGDYPVDAVTMMSRTCCEAECALNYDNLYQVWLYVYRCAVAVLNMPHTMCDSFLAFWPCLSPPPGFGVVWVGVDLVVGQRVSCFGQ